MFFAQANIQDTQINFYLHQFSSLVAGESVDRQQFIDSSIEIARSVLNGEKNVFSIPNDRFFLVTFLIDHCSESLQSHRNNKEIYPKIMESLKKEIA